MISVMIFSSISCKSRVKRPQAQYVRKFWKTWANRVCNTKEFLQSVDTFKREEEKALHLDMGNLNYWTTSIRDKVIFYLSSYNSFTDHDADHSSLGLHQNHIGSSINDEMDQRKADMDTATLGERNLDSWLSPIIMITLRFLLQTPSIFCRWR